MFDIETFDGIIDVVYKRLKPSDIDSLDLRPSIAMIYLTRDRGYIGVIAPMCQDELPLVYLYNDGKRQISVTPSGESVSEIQEAIDTVIMIMNFDRCLSHEDRIVRRSTT